MPKILARMVEAAKEATQVLVNFQEEITQVVANNDFQEISNKPVRRNERVVAEIVDPELRAMITVVGRRIDALPSSEVIDASEGEERKAALKAHAHAELILGIMWRELSVAHGLEEDESGIGIREGWKFIRSTEDPLSALLERTLLRMGGPVSIMDLLEEGDCGDPNCAIHGKPHAVAQA